MTERKVLEGADWSVTLYNAEASIILEPSVFPNPIGSGRTREGAIRDLLKDLEGERANAQRLATAIDEAIAALKAELVPVAPVAHEWVIRFPGSGFVVRDDCSRCGVTRIRIWRSRGVDVAYLPPDGEGELTTSEPACDQNGKSVQRAAEV